MMTRDRGPAATVIAVTSSESLRVRPPSAARFECAAVAAAPAALSRAQADSKVPAPAAP